MSDQDGVIPFYGSQNPAMFSIERRAMDRDGAVIAHLDDVLPDGRVLDVGAGNGFTAEQLSTPRRSVVALEPDSGMVDRARELVWVKGTAQRLPFHDASFEAAYATWAFFFEGVDGLEDGLAELDRVVCDGGPIVIVDNAGGDEFCALSPREIASDASRWRARGFECTVIETAYRFDDLARARTLIRFYFGDAAAARVEKTTIEFRVAAYSTLAGPG